MVKRRGTKGDIFGCLQEQKEDWLGGLGSLCLIRGPGKLSMAMNVCWAEAIDKCLGQYEANQRPSAEKSCDIRRLLKSKMRVCQCRQPWRFYRQLSSDHLETQGRQWKFSEFEAKKLTQHGERSNQGIKYRGSALFGHEVDCPGIVPPESDVLLGDGI